MKLIKILAEFIHYYEKRGRDELRSMFATFLGSMAAITAMLFGTSMILFPYMMTAQVILLAAIISIFRSFFSALLYAISPKKFRMRTSSKK